MGNSYTAIIDQDDGWYVATCPEVPGAIGQGRTKQEVLENLTDAIALVLLDRFEEAWNELPSNEAQTVLQVA